MGARRPGGGLRRKGRPRPAGFDSRGCQFRSSSVAASLRPTLQRSGCDYTIDDALEQGRDRGGGGGHRGLGSGGADAAQARARRRPRGPSRATLDGLTILHISDVHAGYGPGLMLLRRCAEWAGELEPDLIAVTGDLVARRRAAPGFAAAAADLVAAARHGAFAVLGNHDLAARARSLRPGLGRRRPRRPHAARRRCGRAVRARAPHLRRRAPSAERTDARARVRPGEPPRRDRRPPHPALPLPGRPAAAARRLGAPRARRAPARRADLPALAGRAHRPRASALRPDLGARGLQRHGHARLAGARHDVRPAAAVRAARGHAAAPAPRPELAPPARSGRGGAADPRYRGAVQPPQPGALRARLARRPRRPMRALQRCRTLAMPSCAAARPPRTAPRPPVRRSPRHSPRWRCGWSRGTCTSAPYLPPRRWSRSGASSRRRRAGSRSPRRSRRSPSAWAEQATGSARWPPPTRRSPGPARSLQTNALASRPALASALLAREAALALAGASAETVSVVGGGGRHPPRARGRAARGLPLRPCERARAPRQEPVARRARAGGPGCDRGGDSSSTARSSRENRGAYLGRLASAVAAQARCRPHPGEAATGARRDRRGDRAPARARDARLRRGARGPRDQPQHQGLHPAGARARRPRPARAPRP